MKKVVVVVSLAFALVAHADAQMGFVRAVFTGSAFDETGDIWSAESATVVAEPLEVYATSCPGKTTYAFGAYMLMSGDTTYNFKGRYDDFVTVKIGNELVVARGGECNEVAGSFTAPTTGWYKVEFRVGNNGGSGGLTSSAYYGILWNTNNDSEWRRISTSEGAVFSTMPSALTDIRVLKTTPLVLSASIRSNDPTVLDVSYIVLSPNEHVNVRALAFEDGERSFWKVVRPETFVRDQDGNETSTNIGDGIAANVPHNLSWKVSADWKTDLAKVKFEVLTSDAAQLPMKLANIEARGNSPSLTVAYGTQTDNDIFNAMLWHYADGAGDLVNNDGYVDTTNGIRLVDRTTIPNRLVTLRYVYDKMGYDALIGGNLLSYARRATRKNLQYNSNKQNSAVLRSSKPESLYIGDKAYCVIDLSSGAHSESYPVYYLDSEPVNGWSDEYKTSKLVLRRVEPGIFLMQGNKHVTLTQPFYIGVYPVTQAQYKLVCGTNPSSNNANEKFPVEISWNDARGNSVEYDWPTIKMVKSDSFVGRLQIRSGLPLDFPTEAQWEYACRAGTTSSYNNGGSDSKDLDVIGKFNNTQGTVRPDYSEVGSYAANLLGLYDMHGNVGEWCLDYCDTLDSDPAIDPLGPEVGNDRVWRGLSYVAWGAIDAASSSRRSSSPDRNVNNYSGGGLLSWCGMRMSFTISE